MTANRVLGIVVSHHGDTAVGIAMCRKSLDAAPSAHVRHLAAVYLVLAYLAAGQYDDAANSALDAGSDSQRSGTDRSFGGYLDALAAEALIRLGRWAEAERLLGRHSPGDTIPVGEVRLLIAGAKLAVRRGDADRAHELLDAASRIPIDAWHETYLVAGIADVELRRRALAACCRRRSTWLGLNSRFVAVVAGEVHQPARQRRGRTTPRRGRR